jgi:hypothetical protein
MRRVGCVDVPIGRAADPIRPGKALEGIDKRRVSRSPAVDENLGIVIILGEDQVFPIVPLECANCIRDIERSGLRADRWSGGDLADIGGIAGPVNLDGAFAAVRSKVAIARKR